MRKLDLKLKAIHFIYKKIKDGMKIRVTRLTWSNKQSFIPNYQLAEVEINSNTNAAELPMTVMSNEKCERYQHLLSKIKTLKSIVH